MLSKRVLVIGMLGVAGMVSHDAKAGWFDYIRYGMGAAGFQQQLKHDVFRDGWVYNFGQTFNNKTYDLGNAELTLSGSLFGEFSFSRRGIDEVEFTLGTGDNGLAYTYEYFDGLNKVTVDDGFLFIDEDIKINKYGFYDLQLNVSNRGTVVDENGNETPLDFDIGPINMHGHWVIDLINLTLGDALGFQLPGGASDQIVAGWFQAAELGLEQAAAKAAANQEVGVYTVPEPATLAMLLAGMGLVVIRRKR